MHEVLTHQGSASVSRPQTETQRASAAAAPVAEQVGQEYFNVVDVVKKPYVLQNTASEVPPVTAAPARDANSVRQSYPNKREVGKTCLTESSHWAVGSYQPRKAFLSQRVKNV